MKKTKENKETEKRDIVSIIGLMDILNSLELGESRMFIANNKRFAIIKVSNVSQ